MKPVQRLLKKGEWLFVQEDPVANFYYVKTGKIKLIRNTLEGTQVLVHVAVPGETFAEASLFSDKYHCSAISASESEIVGYNKVDLLRYLEQHPAAMKDLLQLYSQQVMALRTINEIKNIHSAKERILAFFSHEMDAGNQIHLNIPLKDIAYKIGLAHETFYRELKNLEQAGIVMRNGKYLTLL